MLPDSVQIISETKRAYPDYNLRLQSSSYKVVTIISWLNQQPTYLS
jgi:hypothetical protein